MKHDEAAITAAPPSRYPDRRQPKQGAKMPEHDWTWHTVWDDQAENDLIILSDDSRIRLEIRATGARFFSQAQVEMLAADALASLQDALASPKRLRKQS